MFTLISEISSLKLLLIKFVSQCIFTWCFFLSEDSGCAVLNPSKFLSIMKQEKAFSLLMVRFITGQSQPHDCGVSGLTFDSGIKSKPVLCFSPQPLRAVGVLFSPMVSRWASGPLVRRAGSGKKFVRAVSLKP